MIENKKGKKENRISLIKKTLLQPDGELPQNNNKREFFDT